MGFNTTVLVLNDAVHQIENDPEFGKNLASAIREVHGTADRIYVGAGGHVNAATVIETHHADSMVLVGLGGNRGIVLGHAGHYRNDELDMLKYVADTMGYTLRKKPVRKTSSRSVITDVLPD